MKLVKENITSFEKIKSEKDFKDQLFNKLKPWEWSAIMFTNEKDYFDFKNYLEQENMNKIIVKDIGKSKYSTDTGGWYMKINIEYIKDLYGNYWQTELEADFPSILIA